MRLYSLRVKTSIFLLLLVVAMSVLLILLGNSALQSLLEKNRSSRYLSYQHQIAGMLRQSREDLSQLTELFVLWRGGRAADPTILRGVFDQQWEYLRESWNLASLRLYFPDGGSPVTWGDGTRRLSPHQVKEIAISGQPRDGIHCAAICVHSLAVPVVAADGTELVLQVDRSLADELLGFREITGSDIGILSAAQADSLPDGADYLLEWQRGVIALTSRESILPLLHQVARWQREMPGLRLSESYQLNGRSYDVKTLPVVSGDERGAQFVIVDDVTAQVSHIDGSVRSLLLFAVIGALAIVAVVIIMLWHPILRLRRLAEALPLLSDGKFDSMRGLVQPVRKRRDQFDEIDVLDYTALSVCDQLEVMREIVSQNTAELERMAMHDALTGLANRHCIVEELNQFLQGGGYEQGAGYLFFIDLDDFKHINDSLGHQGGDELLRVVAKRLMGVMRSGDVVARLGGDEFCVFVRTLPNDGTYRALAEKMLSIVAEPVRIGDNLVRVTLSIGVVAIPEHGTSLEQVMQNADIAMYHAKHDGKNGYQLFSPTLPEAEKLSGERDMRGKLEVITGGDARS